MSTPLPPQMPPQPVTVTVPLPADAWRERLAASAVKSSGLIFTWCVTSASYDLEPSVVLAKYGDGYAQRRPAGINTQNRLWNIEMHNVSAQTTTAVLDFLEARNGVDVFNWTPPRYTTAQVVICPSWTFAYADLVSDGERVYTVTMKFEQVHV